MARKVSFSGGSALDLTTAIDQLCFSSHRRWRAVKLLIMSDVGEITTARHRHHGDKSMKIPGAGATLCGPRSTRHEPKLTSRLELLGISDPERLPIFSFCQELVV